MYQMGACPVKVKSLCQLRGNPLQFAASALPAPHPAHDVNEGVEPPVAVGLRLGELRERSFGARVGLGQLNEGLAQSPDLPRRGLLRLFEPGDALLDLPLVGGELRLLVEYEGYGLLHLFSGHRITSAPWSLEQVDYLAPPSSPCFGLGCRPSV